MAYIPYGYRIVNGRAVIDEEMQKQVTMLYECFAAGATYKQSQETSGVKRTPKACRYLLQDTTYLGDDFYPPLLDKELFEMAQAERIRRGPGRGGRKKRTDMPVLTHFRLGDDLHTNKEDHAVKIHGDNSISSDDLPKQNEEGSAGEGLFSLGDSGLSPDGAEPADPFAKAVSFYERIIPVEVAAAGKAG